MKKDFIKMFKKHGSTLMCFFAAGGVALTAVLTAKETPKFIELIDSAEKEKGEKLTTIEKIKVASKPFAPALLSGVMTAICIFGANALNKKQQASVAGAYVLLSDQYRRYINKVKDTFGEGAHNGILSSIAIEKAEDIPVIAQTVTGGLQSFDGSDEERVLFFDGYSQRYFESTISHVLQAEYHINRNHVLGGDISLNDFYLFLGLDKVEGGDEVGWFIDSYDLEWIDFENIPMKLDDGTKYYMICITFAPEPHYWCFDDTQK